MGKYKSNFEFTDLNFEFRPEFYHAQIVSLSQKKSLVTIFESIVHKVATK